MTPEDDAPAIGAGPRLGEDETAAPRRGGGAKDGASSAERALGVALRHLNRRERTEAEMTAHLAAKGFEEATVAATVAGLHEDGLLDDTRFARLFVEDKRNLEGWGSERIARSLRERGVDGATVAVALADVEAFDGSSEHDRALAVLARRFPEPPRDRRERERAFGLLLRKGYDSEVALAALQTHADAA